MAGDLSDHLRKRARELGLDRADTLTSVQEWLDRHYPGQARAVSINNGVLKLITPSASVAGDLRLRQTELARWADRVSIQIASLT